MKRLLAGALTTTVTLLLVAWLTRRRSKPNIKLDHSRDAPLRTSQIDSDIVQTAQSCDDSPSAEGRSELRGKAHKEFPPVARTNDSLQPPGGFLAPGNLARGSLVRKNLDESGAEQNYGLASTDERAPGSSESPTIGPLAYIDKEPPSLANHDPHSSFSKPDPPAVSVAPIVATPDFDQSGAKESYSFDSSNAQSSASSECPVPNSHVRTDTERPSVAEQDANCSDSEPQPPESSVAVALAPAASFDIKGQSGAKESCGFEATDDVISGGGEYHFMNSSAYADCEPSSLSARDAKLLFTQSQPSEASVPTETAKPASCNEPDQFDANKLLMVDAGIGSRSMSTCDSELTFLEESPMVPAGDAAGRVTSPNQAQIEDVGSSATIIQTPFCVLSGAQPKRNLAGIDAAPSEQIGDPESQESEGTPKRYRSPMQAASRQASTRTSPNEAKRHSPNDVLLGVRVRLTFDRLGFCVVGLLPERTSQLDDEVRVTIRGNHFLLVSQEDWYQDLFLDGVGDYLRLGLELRGVLADRRRVRWLLTGRDIYVLASNQSASGFVSTSRLALGRSHVVLCRQELLQQVEAILAEAGCAGYTRISESHGIPSGWCGLRDVAPSVAIPLNPGSDPFYPIKPAPDIEIDLTGGICLRNSIWLAGFPPRIEVLGQQSNMMRVKIDGMDAEFLEDGSIVSEGFDQPGLHSVYCDSLSCSRSYSIVEPPEVWKKWPAYDFGGAAICGPLVSISPAASKRRIVAVPMSNPILIGAQPGQIFRCSRRSVACWKGFVPFDVVWALPLHPLTCDKKTSRILNLATTAVSQKPCSVTTPYGWCTAILDASRKGLRIESDAPDTLASWREYKKVAKNILRRQR
jgi:hypothetical protein